MSANQPGADHLADPLAGNAARHAITDLLDRAVVRADDGDYYPEPERAAEAITSAYDATYEREAGLRRLVLRGAWEVDPEADRRCGDCGEVPGTPPAPGMQRCSHRDGRVPGNEGLPPLTFAGGRPI